MRSVIGILLASLVSVSPLSAQQAAPTPPPASAAQVSDAASAPAQTPVKGATSAATGPAKSKPKPMHYHPDRFAGRAGNYYRVVWGIDSLAVKWAESGEVIRFTYRVLDAGKAKALNDSKLEPALYDPKAGVKLSVPSLENVGALRQSAPPESGKAYWMVFSNKGRFVKRGDHVEVVIGAFHADGLIVD
jgi:hypothetical protein